MIMETKNKSVGLSFIEHCYALRKLMLEDRFLFSSITSRECLEDTYYILLAHVGLNKKIKYRIALWLLGIVK